MNRPETRIFFPNLDGLRLLAFLAIFFHHSLLPAFFDENQHGAFVHFLLEQKKNASLGVNLFFVLSGFLITYLLLAEKAQSGRIHIMHFYFRRALRIWPLYFLVVLAGFYLFPLLKSFTGNEGALHASLPYYLGFASNFDIVHKGMSQTSILNILWSVSVEEQFYLLWPLLLTIIPARFLLNVLVILLAGSIYFRCLNHQHEIILYYHTLSVIGDMLVGGMAAWLCFYNKTFREKLERLPRWLILSFYLAGTGMILFNAQVFSGTAGIVFSRLFFSLFFVFVILEQNYAARSLFKMSGNRIISEWGRYTYGLYCYHCISIVLAHLVTTRGFHIPNGSGLMITDMLLSLVLTGVLAYFSYRYLESPFLKLKDKFAYFTK